MVCVGGVLDSGRGCESDMWEVYSGGYTGQCGVCLYVACGMVCVGGCIDQCVACGMTFMCEWCVSGCTEVRVDELNIVWSG